MVFVMVWYEEDIQDPQGIDEKDEPEPEELLDFDYSALSAELPFRHVADAAVTEQEARAGAGQRYFRNEISLPGINPKDEQAYFDFKRREHPSLVAHFLETLDRTGGDPEGKCEIDGGTVRVTPGHRKHLPLTRAKIAEALYIFGLGDFHYHAEKPTPEFCAEYIAPLLPDTRHQFPKAWAGKVIRLFREGAKKLGRKKSHLEVVPAQAVVQTAALACNALPEDLIHTREYTLTDRGRELIECAQAGYRAGGSFPAEGVMFLLENEGSLDPRFVSGKPVRMFFEKLPRLLENGLNINRVTALISHLRENGFSAKESAEHAAILARRIYSGQEKGWWFKEDLDLRPLAGKKTTSEDLLLEREIAEHSGFNFQYMRLIYRRGGEKLSSIEGITRKRALCFTAKATKYFGIGNMRRACNAAAFACDVISEVPPEERSALLDRLEKCFFDWRDLRIDVVEDRREDHHLVAIRGFNEFMNCVLSQTPGMKRAMGDESYIDFRRLNDLEAALNNRRVLASGGKQPPRIHALLGWLYYIENAPKCWTYDDEAYWRNVAAFMPDPFNPPEHFIWSTSEFKPHGEFSLGRREGESELGCFLDLASRGFVDLEAVQRVIYWVSSPEDSEEHIRALNHPSYPHSTETYSWSCLSSGYRDEDRRRQTHFWPNQRFYAVREVVKAIAERYPSGAVPSIDPEFLLEFLDIVCEVYIPNSREHGRQLACNVMFESLAGVNMDQSLLERSTALSRIFLETEYDLAQEPKQSFAEIVRSYERAVGQIMAADKDSLLDHDEVRRALWEPRFEDIHLLLQRRLTPGSADTTQYSPVERANAMVLSSASAVSLSAYAYHIIPQLPPIAASARDNRGSRAPVSGSIPPPGSISVGMGEYLDFLSAGDHFKQQLRSVVVRARTDTFGLLPVGAKYHVMSPIDPAHVEAVRELMSIGNTSFHLQHSDTTLVLPPVPSWHEMMYLTGLLEYFGVITSEHPELQVCIEGRLSPELCPFLGASVMLASERMPQLTSDTFVTTHNEETGFRMMAYDAGGQSLPFPFGLDLGEKSFRSGRTDILGRSAVSDVKKYQLLGTVLMRFHEGKNGPFAVLAEPFCRALYSLLSEPQYGLESVLTTSWIKVNRQDEEYEAAKKHYYEAVLPCMNAYRGTDIVDRVRALFAWLESEVHARQQEMLASPEYEKEREVLFSF